VHTHADKRDTWATGVEPLLLPRRERESGEGGGWGREKEEVCEEVEEARLMDEVEHLGGR
jgi:hypothetical protein